MGDLRAFLQPLGLDRYQQVFLDEEITDVSLLRSMGDEMLRESMEELEMEPGHIDVLAQALFGGGGNAGLGTAANEDKGEGEDEDEDEDLLALEDNTPEGTSSEGGMAAVVVPAPAAEPVAQVAAAPTVSSASRKAAERVKAQGNDALKNGMFAEAISLYAQAIGLDPTNAVYYSNRSNAYASLHRHEAALSDARQAVALKPEWAKAHLRLAAAFTGLRRFPEARDAFAAALALEPRNAQIKGMLEAARATAELESELAPDTFDWLQEVNERVPPNPFYERGLELQDDAPMTIEYKEALQTALTTLAAEEGKPRVQTAKGGSIVIESIAGSNFEKLVCVGRRAGDGGGPSSAGSAILKGVLNVPVAVKVWHMRSDWRGDGDDDEAFTARMARRAAAEHARVKQLSGCKHWLQLVADVAAEREAVIGGEAYPAIFVEHFPGKDLSELLVISRPPPSVNLMRAAAKQRLGDSGAGGGDNHSSDDDSDDGENADVEEGEAMRAEWEEAVRAYSPEQLGKELGLIREFVLGSLRAMKEAHDQGLRFEPDGSEGPFLADVLMVDGKLKMIDTEALAEYDEDDTEREFSAQPLVYSPVGEYIRGWWEGTASKVGMVPGAPCPDLTYQRVLDGYGTLNWLLFKWEPKQLQGDTLLQLLINGPQEQRAPVDPSLEAHWADFMQRALVMLGPRRFDELKAITNALNAGEIAGADVVARSRYCMGREFEALHVEYLGMLEQLGTSLT